MLRPATPVSSSLSAWISPWSISGSVWSKSSREVLRDKGLGRGARSLPAPMCNQSVCRRPHMLIPESPVSNQGVEAGDPWSARLPSLRLLSSGRHICRENLRRYLAPCLLVREDNEMPPRAKPWPDPHIDVSSRTCLSSADKGFSCVVPVELGAGLLALGIGVDHGSLSTKSVQAPPPRAQAILFHRRQIKPICNGCAGCNWDPSGSLARKQLSVIISGGMAAMILKSGRSMMECHASHGSSPRPCHCRTSSTVRKARASRARAAWMGA